MGMIVVIFGVLNLMYAFHYRNSIGFYAKKKIKQMHNATEFYKVQFKCYFLSFLILCILGIYMLLANGQDTWILVAPLIMHILTFVSLYSSASKGYIDV